MRHFPYGPERLDLQPFRLHNGCMAQFTVRITDELNERIADAASEDKRSKAREIEWLLEAGLSVRAVPLAQDDEDQGT